MISGSVVKNDVQLEASQKSLIISGSEPHFSEPLIISHFSEPLIIRLFSCGSLPQGGKDPQDASSCTSLFRATNYKALLRTNYKALLRTNYKALLRRATNYKALLRNDVQLEAEPLIVRLFCVFQSH